MTYELPLSERIRTFLRLEGLFEQIQHFSQHDNEWHNRAELSCLLDILALSGRTDLKNEISKEVERHTKSLVIFAQNPNVDSNKLEQSIEQLSQLNLTLLSSQGKLDYIVSQVDLLKCLAQRNCLPGGTCDFDLPAYHFWLNQPLLDRREQIQSWTQHLVPIQQAINLLLQFIRASAVPIQKTAHAGFYQQTLEGAQPIKLLRVSLQKDSPYFTEISGGKHRFTVRFMKPSGSERPQQTSADVNFSLSICQL
ncbi:MAG: cell division protein ZapD [Cycloclasticus sp.]|nr:cell division protein ZapD [Cycloclasticus sp.]